MHKFHKKISKFLGAASSAAILLASGNSYSAAMMTYYSINNPARTSNPADWDIGVSPALGPDDIAFGTDPGKIIIDSPASSGAIYINYLNSTPILEIAVTGNSLTKIQKDTGGSVNLDLILNNFTSFAFSDVIDLNTLGNVSIGQDATLTMSGYIMGNVNGYGLSAGRLSLNGSTNLQGNVGDVYPLSNLYVGGTSSYVTTFSNVNVGTLEFLFSGNTFNFGGSVFTGDVNFANYYSTFALQGGTLTGDISNGSNATLNINFNSTITGNVEIGKINVGNYTLNLNGNNLFNVSSTLGTGTIKFGEAATLAGNFGSLVGDRIGAITLGQTSNTNGVNITATNFLGSQLFNINGNTTLNLTGAANNNFLLNAGTTLNLVGGAYSGTIDGETPWVGVLNVNGTPLNVGLDGYVGSINPLSRIDIAGTVSSTSLLRASTIKYISSGANLIPHQIIGNVDFNNYSSTLTLGSGSSVVGDISNGGHGGIAMSGNANISGAVNIGTINTGGYLLTLNGSTTHNISAGTLGTGSITFGGSANLQGNYGHTSAGNRLDTIILGADGSSGGANIVATNFLGPNLSSIVFSINGDTSIDLTGSSPNIFIVNNGRTLTLSGGTYSGEIYGAAAGVGNVSLSELTINKELGKTNSLSRIDIAGNVSTTHSMNASTIRYRSAGVNLGSSSDVIGNVDFNNYGSTLTLGDGSAVLGNVINGASSRIVLIHNSSVTGSVSIGTVETNGYTLSLNGNNNFNISSGTTGEGFITFSGTANLLGKYGNTNIGNRLNTVTLGADSSSGGATIVATNFEGYNIFNINGDTTIDLTDTSTNSFTIASGTTLTLMRGTYNGSTLPTTNNDSTVQVGDGSALSVTYTGTIGANGKSLGKLALSNNSTLSLGGAHTYYIAATTLGKGSILEFNNQITYTGGINSSAGVNQGTIAVRNNVTLNGPVGSLADIGSINIYDNSTLTAGNVLRSQYLQFIGEGTVILGSNAYTGTINFNNQAGTVSVADNANITGIITNADNGTISVSNGTATLNAETSLGYLDLSSGSVILSGARAFNIKHTLGIGAITVDSAANIQGNYGASSAGNRLSLFYLGSNVNVAGPLSITALEFTGGCTVNVNNNTSIDLTNTSDNDYIVDAFRTLTLSSGTYLGSIDGKADNLGTLSITGTVTLSGSIGDTTPLSEVILANNQTFSKNVRTNILNLGTYTATLSGGGSYDISNTTGNGTISITSGGTISGTLGDDADNRLAELYLGANTTANGLNIYATNFSNDGTTRTLSVAKNTNVDVTSSSINDYLINDEATLTLRQGTYTGAIDGKADNQGILSINGTVTISANIGQSHPLAEIILSNHQIFGGAVSTNILNLGTNTATFSGGGHYHISSTTGQGGILLTGGGTISGTLGDNANNRLNSVSLSADATSSDLYLYATNFNDDDTSRTLTVSANTYLDVNSSDINFTINDGVMLALLAGNYSGNVSAAQSGGGTLSIGNSVSTDEMQFNGVLGSALSSLGSVVLQDKILFSLLSSNEHHNVQSTTLGLNSIFNFANNSITYDGNIDGSNDDRGIISIGGSVTFSGAIGSQHQVREIDVRDTGILIAGSNIKAGKLFFTLDGGQVNLGGNKFTGTVDFNNTVTSIVIGSGGEVQGDIQNAANATLSLAGNASLTDGAVSVHSLRVNTRTLTLNGGASYNFDSTVGSGSIIVSSPAALSGLWGNADNRLAQVQFSSNASSTGTFVITANTINGGSGTYTLAVNNDAVVDVYNTSDARYEIADEKKLTLIQGSYSSAITSATNNNGELRIGDGETSYEISMSSQLGSEAINIGLLNIESNSTLTLTSDLTHYVNNVRIASDATLHLVDGTFTGNIDFAGGTGVLKIDDKANFIGKIENGSETSVIHVGTVTYSNDISIGTLNTTDVLITFDGAHTFEVTKGTTGTGTIIVSSEGAVLKGIYGSSEVADGKQPNRLGYLKLDNNINLDGAIIVANRLESSNAHHSYLISVTNDSVMDVYYPVRHSFVISNGHDLKLLQGSYSGQFSVNEEGDGRIIIGDGVNSNHVTIENRIGEVETGLGKLLINSNATLTINSGEPYRILSTIINNNGTLELYGNTSYYGKIDGDDVKNGALVVAGDAIIHGEIGGNNPLSEITVKDTGSLSLYANAFSNVLILENDNSEVNLIDSSYNGTVDYTDHKGVITLQRGTINGDFINSTYGRLRILDNSTLSGGDVQIGLVDLGNNILTLGSSKSYNLISTQGEGTISIAEGASLSGAFGNKQSRLAQIILDGNYAAGLLSMTAGSITGTATINVDDNTAVDVTETSDLNFIIKDQKTLTLYAGTYSGTIDGEADRQGLINIAGVVNLNGKVGDSFLLKSILVQQEGKLTIGENIAVDNIKFLANQGRVDLGSKNFKGIIDFNSTSGTFVLGNGASITGSMSNADLGRIILDGDASFEGNSAGNIDIGTHKLSLLGRYDYNFVSVSGSGSVYVDGAEAQLSGNFGSKQSRIGELELGADVTSNILSIAAANFTGGKTVTVADALSLDLTGSSNNNFQIMDGKVVTLAGGTYTGSFRGLNYRQGAIAITGNVQLNNQATQGEAIDEIVVRGNGKLDLGSSVHARMIRFSGDGGRVNLNGNYFEGDIDFGGANSVLTAGGVNIIGGTISTSTPNTGTLVWTDGKLAKTIGTKLFPLFSCEFAANGSLATISPEINAKNIYIKSHVVDFNNVVNADAITISNGANLILRSNSINVGDIFGETAGVGTLTMDFRGSNGFNVSKLSQFNLKVENYSITDNFEAREINILSPANLTTGSLEGNLINLDATLVQTGGEIRLTGQNPKIYGQGTLEMQNGGDVLPVVGSENDALNGLVFGGRGPKTYNIRGTSHYVHNIELKEDNTLSLGGETRLNQAALTIQNNATIALAEFPLTIDGDIISEGNVSISTTLTDIHEYGSLTSSAGKIDFTAGTLSININDQNMSQDLVGTDIAFLSAPHLEFREVKFEGETKYKYELQEDGKLKISENAVTFIPAINALKTEDFLVVHKSEILKLVEPEVIQFFNSANQLSGEAYTLYEALVASGETIAENEGVIDRHLSNEFMNISAQTISNSIIDVVSTISSRVNLVSNYITTPMTEAPQAISSGDDSISNNRVWVQSFGSKASQRKKYQNPGYKSGSFGGSVGADSNISENNLLGFAISYADSNVKFKDQNNGDKLKSKSWMFTLYGSHNITDNLYVAAAGTYAHSDVETKMLKPLLDETNTVSKGVYVNRTYVLDTSVNYLHKMKDSLYLSPELGLLGIISRDSEYTEKGGLTNRTIRRNSSLQNLQGYLGAKLGAHLDYKSYDITPMLRARVTQDYTAKKPITISKTNGVPNVQTSKHQTLNKRLYELGADVAIKNKALEFSVGYTATMAEKYIGHSGAIRLKVSL